MKTFRRCYWKYKVYTVWLSKVYLRTSLFFFQILLFSSLLFLNPNYMITFSFNCDQKKNIYIYISLSLSLLVQQNKSCKQSNIEDAEMVMRGVICIILERERERVLYCSSILGDLFIVLNHLIQHPLWFFFHYYWGILLK